jgi:cation diffusion facilitator family transporter
MAENRLSFKEGEKAAMLSTIILLSLGILKGVVSFTSGSVALLAGTIDSFSDVLSSIAVWVGLKIARKKPTESFPYGYYKAETFALLIVSTIIVASSILIMMESFQKFFEVHVVSFLDVALVVSALSTIIYYLLAKYKMKVGRQIGSQALISEGLHSKVDVYTSLLVFAGVFLALIGFQFGEALIGFVIGAYVLARGLLFGKDAVLVLMDVSPSPQKGKEMRIIAESVPGVKGTHDVRLRKSGPVFFCEIHLELQEGLSLERAHLISETVEARIKEHFKDLELITVHVGLAHRKKKTRIAVPIVEDKGLESSVNLHFGNAPYFAFIDVEKDQIVGSYVKANEGAKLSHKKGIQAANLLVKENVDVVLAGAIGEGPFHVLGDNLIEMYLLSKSMKIKEAVLFLTRNLLERMVSPTETQREPESLQP